LPKSPNPNSWSSMMVIGHHLSTASEAFIKNMREVRILLSVLHFYPLVYKGTCEDCGAR
jgi:hypothetical protein